MSEEVRVSRNTRRQNKKSCRQKPKLENINRHVKHLTTAVENMTSGKDRSSHFLLERWWDLGVLHLQLVHSTVATQIVPEALPPSKNCNKHCNKHCNKRHFQPNCKPCAKLYWPQCTSPTTTHKPRQRTSWIASNVTSCIGLNIQAL